MSDTERLSSDFSSDENEAMSTSVGENTGGLLVFRSGNFAPYQGEPLARADNSAGEEAEEEEEEEEGDEDGILPSVLEQRLEGNVPVNEW